jgi:hypothetical protein
VGGGRSRLPKPRTSLDLRVEGTAIDEAKQNATIVAGGSYDDSEGWFVRPTVVETEEIPIGPTNTLLTDSSVA